MNEPGGEPLITCTKCGAQIKVSESLAAPLLEQFRKKVELERPKLIEQARLDARAELESTLKKLETEAAEQRRDAVEQRKKVAAFEQSELALRKDKQQLEDDKRALALEVQRQVDAGRQKERESALKEFDEQRKLDDDKQRLKDAENAKVNEDLKRKVEELTRKLEQGSQQLHGEVQELDLEAALREEFPRDAIEPVAKGQFGGDCVQRVFSPSGQLAGSILWETKRTKSFSEGWLAKLRDDQRVAKAELAILLSHALPKEIERFASREGVWVTEPGCALALAHALRHQLLEVASARRASEGQQDKMEALYAYLTGPQFRQKVEALLESYKTLREDLDAERRAMERQWARREKQLDRMMQSTARMWGDLEGIAGGSLPEIEGLSPRALEAGGDEASAGR